MQDELPLDALDQRIIRALQTNGRLSYEELGTQVGLSASAALRRVKRLEEAGVIAGYVALVSARHVGLALTAYINVRMEKHTGGNKRSPMDVFRGRRADLARGRRMRLADRRDGLPAAHRRRRHGPLHAVRDGHAAQALRACRTARRAS
jgi:DNA-binding Lrp family transcriptional regulator